MLWYKDLCEYYGVSSEEAINLGVRKTGRKPNLPGSKTCKPVSNKTFEELWDDNPRETIEQKMNFYKDIGAWQVFRQCNYRNKFDYSSVFGEYLFDGASILEYGCGVAPFTSYVLENYPDYKNINFTLVDVGGEHLEFAKWRLAKNYPWSKINVHEVTPETIVPIFSSQFDIVCIMDVLEHLPNPYDVIVNIFNHCNQGSILVETWVDKSDGKHGGPDLEEAEKDRHRTNAFLNEKFHKIKNGSMRTYRRR